MKCVKCNNLIGEEDIYCGYCGVNQARFIKYLNKVADKIHKDRDNAYNSNVRLARRKLSQLEQDKKSEIERIENSRWTRVNDNIKYNKIEGVVLINNERYNFDEIKGAEIVKNNSYRVVTIESGESKKHVSLGKAVVGGALFGPIGALAGGAMGKTTSSGNTTSNSIPICTYIGVKINIKGFDLEVAILSNSIDCASNIYKTKINEAQKIVDNLRIISTYPVPKKSLKAEEEQSVLDYDLKIEMAAKELKKTIEDRPKYDIPNSYFE